MMEFLGLADGSLVLGGVLQDVTVVACRVVFFLSAVLLMVIVLLQEGKGGGLASALGGQGAETFGVSSGGVNKVTLWLAGIFLVSALGHTMAYKSTVQLLRDENRGKAETGRTPPPFDGTIPGLGEDGGDGGDDAPPEDGSPKKEEPPKDAPPKETPPPPKEEAPKPESPPPPAPK
jgi:preprotein translocase subunit SecG